MLITDLDKLDEKEFYTIKDLCKVTGRKAETIRSWERKGIIKKPEETIYSVGFSGAGWRKYNREVFVQTLQDILDYDWKNNVIKNLEEIQMCIDYLK